MQYNRKLFIIFCLAMVAVNVVQHNAENTFPKSVFVGLGASFLSIPIWILIGGYVIFNFLHTILNLLKPDNRLKFTHWDKANAGLVIGMIIKGLFGIKV